MITKKYNKTKGSCKVTFSLTKEQVGEKRDVRVLADFNNWNWIEGTQLKEGKDKYSGSVELPAQFATYQFRYLLDGNWWMNDPEAESYPPNIHGSTNCAFELQYVVPAEKVKKATPKKATTKKPAAKKAAPKKTVANKPAAKKATPKKVVAKKAPAKKAAPKKVAKADDLKRIEGIGPKIAGLLNDAGITTFAGLGKASLKKLKDVLEAAGPRFRLAKPDSWKQQAKLAAAGKDTELKKLQDELKGGVKKK